MTSIRSADRLTEPIDDLATLAHVASPRIFFAAHSTDLTMFW
jgi:hypothetical protein